MYRTAPPQTTVLRRHSRRPRRVHPLRRARPRSPRRPSRPPARHCSRTRHLTRTRVIPSAARVGITQPQSCVARARRRRCCADDRGGCDRHAGAHRPRPPLPQLHPRCDGTETREGLRLPRSWALATLVGAAQAAAASAAAAAAPAASRAPCPRPHGARRWAAHRHDDYLAEIAHHGRVQACGQRFHAGWGRGCSPFPRLPRQRARGRPRRPHAARGGLAPRHPPLLMNEPRPSHRGGYHRWCSSRRRAVAAASSRLDARGDLRGYLRGCAGVEPRLENLRREHLTSTRAPPT